MPRLRPRLPILLLSLSAVGCSQSVQVQTTFPEPLVEPLPVAVAVNYPEALTSYTYSEELPADSVDWTFSIGSANQLLFESIFGELFTRIVTVDATRADGVIAVLQPTIEAFEFSLPRHSRSDQYGVWIKYSINVYSPDGELRTNWPVKGYGEVDSRRFKGNATMRQATVLAMRDAATIIIDSLDRDTAFRRAVLGETGSRPTAAEATEVASVDTPAEAPAELESSEDVAEERAEVGRVEEQPPELAGEEQNGES